LANVALVLNLVLLLALLSVLGATLTMPGIAGIVLTMGMAVDANVLIYERIREELRNGRSILSATQAGFERAFGTILDANLTTLAAAGLLFFFGSGPIKGFAVTLTLGLMTSMFTAIMVTRLMVGTWIRVRRPKTMPL
ncbi:MAG TPA: MMPL family transporter, partial [Candidatus Omnitrophota bacterium]|nr:MMPL family transporter [Candidatus Omnitrophota bacterium]